LRAHANDGAPWEAFVFEVASARDGRPPLFLRHSIERKAAVKPAEAAELANRLASDSSYIDADYGCVGEAVGYRLARGTATLDFIVDCGHFSLGNDDGHAAVLSKDMIEFLGRLRPAKSR
jgi:hypothetical protein